MKTISKTENARALRQAKKIRAINILGGCCSQCGNNNHYVLQFHHISKYNKNNIISSLLWRQKGWNEIEKEIKKCILLCANCHENLHHPFPRSTKLQILNIIGKNKCDDCGLTPDNVSCLDFHHMTDKNFQIGTHLQHLDHCKNINYKIEAILNELNKCLVLCKNCHIMRHIDINKYNRIQKIINNKLYSHKPYNTIDIKTLKDLYCVKGLNTLTIGKHMGHSQSTILKYIKQYNLVKGITVSNEKKEFIEKVKKMYSDGYGTRKISKILECSRGKDERIVNPQYWIKY